MNTKLHAITDFNGRPLNFFMTASQVSDYISAAALLTRCRRRYGCSATGDMTWTRSGIRFRRKT
jgi:hypothetical protein